MNKKSSHLILTAHARQRIIERKVPSRLVVKLTHLYRDRNEVLVFSPAIISLHGYPNLKKYLVLVVADNCVVTCYWKNNLGEFINWYTSFSQSKKRNIRLVF